MSAIESQQVSFFPVHEFVQRYLDTAGHYPPAGTPAWCELADGDRRKWAALLDAAQHHVLRVEIGQEALAEASKAVTGAADWSKVAQEIRGRSDFYARNPWAKRRVA